jgi:ABC-type Fe3+-hydroxamate transport system substrate-binding protein
MIRPGLLAIGIVLLCAACSNDTSTSTTSASTTTPPGPGTQTLNAVMAPAGSAVRTFDASAAGTVTVTLNSTAPATVVGLGIGVPGNAVGGCDMITTVNTAGGSTPQLSVAVDAGTFCAGAFDRGAVGSGGVLVTITIVHP